MAIRSPGSLWTGMIRMTFWLLLINLCMVGQDRFSNPNDQQSQAYSSWRMGTVGNPWLRFERWGSGHPEPTHWSPWTWVFDPDLTHLIGLLGLIACHRHLLKQKPRTA
jgi:hypothetical protein